MIYKYERNKDFAVFKQSSKECQIDVEHVWIGFTRLFSLWMGFTLYLVTTIWFWKEKCLSFQNRHDSGWNTELTISWFFRCLWHAAVTSKDIHTYIHLWRLMESASKKPRTTKKKSLNQIVRKRSLNIFYNLFSKISG